MKRSVTKRLAKSYMAMKGDSMNTDGTGCMVMAIITLAILAFNIFIGGLLVQYSVEYWGSRAKEKQVDVKYWKCCLIAIPLAELALPVAAVTWMISWFD